MRQYHKAEAPLDYYRSPRLRLLTPDSRPAAAGGAVRARVVLGATGPAGAAALQSVTIRLRGPGLPPGGLEIEAPALPPPPAARRTAAAAAAAAAGGGDVCPAGVVERDFDLRLPQLRMAGVLTVEVFFRLPRSTRLTIFTAHV